MAKSSRRSRRQRTRRNAGRDTTYSRNIYKLLKCVCPDLSISVLAMNVMNSFVEDLLERISTEASHLVHQTFKSTMGPNDIIAATKLIIQTPELCKYAIEMAHRTVKYTEQTD